MPNAFVSYLKLFRFPLVFTAIADSAAGYLLAQPRPLHPFALVLLAVASTGLYFLGMALNDIADIERDRKIAPQRVLPSGRIALCGAIVAAGLSTAASFVAVLLVLEAPWIRLAVWAGVFACILAYDLFLKFPPVMGLVRAGNFLLGVSCASQGQEPQTWMRASSSWLPYLTLCAAPFVYVTALTLVSTVEEGRIRRPIVLAGVGGMSLAALLPLIFRSAWYFHDVLWAMVPAGILILWVLARAWKATDRKGVMLLVRDGVAGIILLDATQLAAAGRFVSAGAIASLLLPAALCVAWFKKLA